MSVDSEELTAGLPQRPAGNAIKRWDWRPALRQASLYAGSLLGLVIVWYLLSLVFPPRVLPGPAKTLAALMDAAGKGLLWVHFSATMVRLLISFAFAMVAGVIVGVLLGLSPKIERVFALWVMVLLTIPSLCYVIISFIWLGLNERAAVVAIAVTVFPSIAINIWSGVKSINSRLVAMARVYRVPRLMRVTRIILPQVLPYIVAASRFGLGIVWKVTVLVELLGLGTGIGYQLNYWYQLYSMEHVFAWTLFFVVIMLVVEVGILKPVEDFLFKWRPEVRA